MSRYIDAEKLCFEILEEYGISTGGDDVTEIYGMIINQPTADVRENVRGEWLPDMIYDGEDEWCFVECSNCKYRADKHYDFCPNCGADMRGDKP